MKMYEFTCPKCGQIMVAAGLRTVIYCSCKATMKREELVNNGKIEI